MVKIIKENGQVLHRFMYKAQPKKNKKGEIAKLNFMELLHQRLDPHARVGDWVELGVMDTMQYDPYEDKSQNAETLPVLDEEPEVTTEWWD